MNREQWLRKRSHVETAGTPPAFGAANFAGLTHMKEMPGSGDQDFAEIREQHFADTVVGDEWPTANPEPDETERGSH